MKLNFLISVVSLSLPDIHALTPSPPCGQSSTAVARPPAASPPPTACRFHQASAAPPFGRDANASPDAQQAAIFSPSRSRPPLRRRRDAVAQSTLLSPAEASGMAELAVYFGSASSPAVGLNEAAAGHRESGRRMKLGYRFRQRLQPPRPMHCPRNTTNFLLRRLSATSLQQIKKTQSILLRRNFWRRIRHGYAAHFGESEYHSDDQLMDKVRLAEGAVHEITNEYRLSIMEEVRSKISSLESLLVNENENFLSSTTKIDKYRELQVERARKFDLQYQRTIAEALDNHLTAVQTDHEHISQLEERRIRDDMAREEAKRREKSIQEQMRQERVKAEEEVKLKAELAEAAKAVAIEAEKKAAEEAAAKRASETLNTAHNVRKDSNEAPGPSSSTFDGKKGVKSSVRNIIKASENALELERKRREIYEELFAKNKVLEESVNQYHRHGQTIGRLIRTISATIENIRTRAEELVKLINNQECPQPISIKLFTEKIISNCTNQKSSDAIFATSRVVVLVTFKIPLAMDILIAELNRVCIYTVPKHISYSQEAFKTKDDYFKAIGYKEENGKLESIDDFVERLSCYIKLYGALVQSEVGGIQNLHGLTEGWAWLARFLNNLPANLFTAVALDSFLEMAGYTLYCRYKNQFEKLLSIIARDFLNALQGGGESTSAKLSKVKMSIRNYIETKQYKKKPEGLQLRSHLDSRDCY